MSSTKEKHRRILWLLFALLIAACNCELGQDNSDTSPKPGNGDQTPGSNDESEDDDERSCPPSQILDYEGYIPNDSDRAEFSYHYRRWLLTCCNGSKLLSSKVNDYTVDGDSEDYAQLIAMGKRAIPLIIQAMREEGEFFLNDALSKITGIDDVIVEIGYDPYKLIQANSMGEQERMKAWVKWWSTEKYNKAWYPCPKDQKATLKVHNIPCSPNPDYSQPPRHQRKTSPHHPFLPGRQGQPHLKIQEGTAPPLMAGFRV